MRDKEGGAGQDRYVDMRQLRKFVLYPLAALSGAYVLYIWLGPALTGARISLDRYSDLSPLVRQAREDSFTYGQAAAYGDSLAGKYAIWCVQNREEWNVTVDGDPGKRLNVSNYPAMPVYTGNKHQACVPMLLLLEKSGTDARVRVFFKEAL
ncbi:MAG: hypothetical protein M0025_12025 [Elusimicrobia bacterium]|nr:hypothetical protein [Elusimicrobiota bacterium]MDA8244829.1 hypothetical protein [Elusimicrobiota bacterium]